MPIIVACTKCSRQLRVSDELMGRKVRCPACEHTFDAVVDPPADPGPGATEEWRELNLEMAGGKQDAAEGGRDQKLDLDLAPPGGAAEPKRPAEQPVETVPIEPWRPPPMELDAPPREERPAAREEPREEERRPRPRLNDDHDDLRPCRSCGRMIHRDAARCYSCGQRLREGRDEPEPEERRRDSDRRDSDRRDYGRRDSGRRDDVDRRRPRRDSEPHRGGLILTFGIIAVSTLFVCWPLAPVALILGICAWTMGSADLRKMRAGTMDPEGEGLTRGGWVCGIIGVVLNLVVFLGCGFIFTMAMIDESSRKNNRPKFAPPPVQQPGRRF